MSIDLSSLTSYYTDLASTTSSSSNSISSLTSDSLSEATDDELMDVCKQFEAYFLEQVFKEMQKTAEVWKDDDDDSDSYASQITDYFTDSYIQELASTSTEQNSLGIAQTLYEQLKRNYSL